MDSGGRATACSGGGWARIAIWLPALAAEEVFQRQESRVALVPAAAVLAGTVALKLLCTEVLSAG